MEVAGPAVHGEVRQEAPDLLHAHLAGMALAVEEHEAADPADVRLLGPQAQVRPAALRTWSSSLGGLIRLAGGCGGTQIATESELSSFGRVSARHQGGWRTPERVTTVG